MSSIPDVYLPPTGGPVYWQDDTTGVLPRAIKAFLAEGLGGPPATPEQLELVRKYFEYFIQAPCWQIGTEEDTPKLFQAFAELRERIKSIHTSAGLAGWASDCLNLGLDPL